MQGLLDGRPCIATPLPVRRMRSAISCIMGFGRGDVAGGKPGGLDLALRKQALAGTRTTEHQADTVHCHDRMEACEGPMRPASRDSFKVASRMFNGRT